MHHSAIDKEAFSKRLKGLLIDKKESTYSVAKVAHLSPATISRYANGVMSPKVTTVETLARYFNVNPVWLMGYNVQKEPPLDDEGDLKKIIENNYGESSYELLSNYLLLNNNSKKNVINTIYKLLDMEENT